MQDEVYEQLGTLLTEVGNEISVQVGSLPRRAYLFAACEDNWAQVGLYVDEGNRVRSYNPSNVLFDLAIEIWKLDNAKRPKKLRWVYFDYDINDGKFKTHFVFLEDVSRNMFVGDWQDEAVKKRFGDKPMAQTGWDDPVPD